MTRCITVDCEQKRHWLLKPAVTKQNKAECDREDLTDSSLFYYFNECSVRRQINCPKFMRLFQFVRGNLDILYYFSLCECSKDIIVRFFRDFFSSEMNGTVEKIGELSVFHTERHGIGRFGTAVFIGNYNEGIAAEDVAVKMMENGKIWIDSSLYLKANGQPNVIKYYGTHETHPKLT